MPHMAAMGMWSVRHHASSHAKTIGASHLRGGHPMRRRLQFLTLTWHATTISVSHR